MTIFRRLSASEAWGNCCRCEFQGAGEFALDTLQGQRLYFCEAHARELMGDTRMVFCSPKGQPFYNGELFKKGFKR